MTSPLANPLLYEGMTLGEIIRERKATLDQVERFYRQRPTLAKEERIEELNKEIRALGLLDDKEALSHEREK